MDYESLKKNEKYEITFVENVFTTELNNLYDNKSEKAKRQDGFSSHLKKRKEEFFKTDFIQQFKIVIITAIDNKYIETYQGEVCELFDVEFLDKKTVGENGIMWIHKGNSFPKLVIHTRHLTSGASDALLIEIANVIKSFIKENGIEILVK